MTDFKVGDDVRVKNFLGSYGWSLGKITDIAENGIVYVNGWGLFPQEMKNVEVIHDNAQ